jgi:hypothetical protein
MNEELKLLLEKYEADNLTTDERRRLAALVATPEGRRQALASPSPEVVFLAGEKESPAWDGFWHGMQQRVQLHHQLLPHKTPWIRIAAAAAILIVAVLIFVNEYSNRAPVGSPATTPAEASGQKPETPALTTRTFKLAHRLPAEVLNELRPLMSDAVQLHIPEGGREIRITDKAENLDRIARALQMLDTPAGTLPIRLKLMFALGGEQPEIREAAAVEKVDIDSSKYRLADELLLTPSEGRRYVATLNERYQVQCFAKLGENGTALELRDFSIYDLQTGSIVRREGLRIPLGESILLNTDQRNDRGEPLVIVLATGHEER